VGRGDGTLLFLRDISSGWSGDAARVKQEIDRTTLYAKQQFGVEITTVWIAGEGSESVPQLINDSIDAEVLSDPLVANGLDWAKVVTTLPSKLTSNFIPWYVQQRPRRRMILHGGLAVAALLLLFTVATVATVEVMLHEHSEDSGELRAREAELQGELLTLQNRAREVEEERHRLQVFQQLDRPQAPLLFLRQLGAVQPRGIVLHALQVGAERSHWPFMLQGQAGSDPNQGLELVDLLERRLDHPPLAVTLSQRGEVSWQRAVQSGDARTFTRPLQFTIRGVMK
ncbi:MAG: hypothetical protein Q9M13_08425, partial [Mariprofundales bacterium]|nr:hypothetical protein [Mariprofundales bacterium]